MPISHRLATSMFDRPDDGENAVPKRIIFLSVEGNTEKDYFSLIHKYREKLAINTLIHIETLSHLSRDTASDPESVYDLLEEFMSLREHGILSEEVFAELDSADIREYSKEFIESYLNDEPHLTIKQKSAFRRALSNAKISLDYRKFLADFKGSDGQDVFAIVIDRDKDSGHTPKHYQDLIEKCRKNDVQFILSNPCFEFWLLLHLCNVKEEYADRLDKIMQNERVSSQHTFVSKEVSDRAHHAKALSWKRFEEHYLHHIDDAIDRAKDFAEDELSLIDNIGTNIPRLFEIMRT